MKLVIITMLLIVVVFVVAAIAEAVFGIHLPFVTETQMALTGNSGIGAARNAYVDAPIRLAGSQSSPATLPPPPPTK